MEYVSDHIVRVLRDAGCRYLPLVPGASFRGLHDSVVNQQVAGGPEVITCTSEMVAVAVAHAYAKATRGVGYAVVHDLVGLMQASMSVYNAWVDRAPVVVLGGGGPADPAKRRPVDWYHSANVQSGLIRDFVKWSDDPITAQATIDSIARAHRTALTEPQGPVYVTLDSALQEEVAAEVDLPPPDAFAAPPPSGARQAEVEAAARRLLDARLPVIVAGRVGLDPTATPLLTRLAERLAAGLRDERNLNAVPSCHPLNLTGDSQLLMDADVILCVEAADLNLLHNQAGLGSRECELIDLSQNELRLQSWANAGQTRALSTRWLPAQGRYGLEQINDAVDAALMRESNDRSGTRQRRRAELEDRRSTLLKTLAAKRASGWDASPVSTPRLVSELYEVVRDEPWLLTLRNTRSWPEQLWGFERGGQYLGHSGGGGVGYGPGALIGGALAARDRGELAVGVIGDGDLMYSPGALWTASHYQIPMLAVVHNNRSYHNDEEHQRAVAQARARPLDRAHIGVRLDEPAVDFAALANSHGAVGIGPVTEPDHLRTALSDGLKAAKAGATVLVDVHTA
jgi:thiamine pyrophosphate-dependent acetolactate synthase large subunit-like protein